ncbi:MAG: VOC family protein [Polyangia bacterium]
MNRYIFHLSLPVSDLASSERFYVEVLGASIGRVHDAWLDVLLWGHQITLQHRPDEVLPVERQGKRHFGVVLPWNVWREEIARLERIGAKFLAPPVATLGGTENEHAKAYLADPSGNVIELKAYRDVQRTLGLADAP